MDRNKAFEFAARADKADRAGKKHRSPAEERRAPGTAYAAGLATANRDYKTADKARPLVRGKSKSKGKKRSSKRR